MDKHSPSERRGFASAFATACLALLAWAFPDMTRILTVPAALFCFGLAIYFLWPEIIRVAARLFQRQFWSSIVVLLFVGAAIWSDYWYYSNYSTNGGIWHIQLGLPVTQSGPKQQEPLKPPVRLTSTFDRMNYVCDKPQGNVDDKAEIQRYLRVIAGAQGWTPKFTDIDSGFKIEGELTNKAEVPQITTEIRRFDNQLYVTRIYFLLGNLWNYRGVSIDPNSADVRPGIAMIEDWIRATPGSCRLN
jgi:hypothetical protein